VSNIPANGLLAVVVVMLFQALSLAVADPFWIQATSKRKYNLSWFTLLSHRLLF
jgi:hypothetical protein